MEKQFSRAGLIGLIALMTLMSACRPKTEQSAVTLPEPPVTQATKLETPSSAAAVTAAAGTTTAAETTAAALGERLMIGQIQLNRAYGSAEGFEAGVKKVNADGVLVVFTRSEQENIKSLTVSGPQGLEVHQDGVWAPYPDAGPWEDEAITLETPGSRSRLLPLRDAAEKLRPGLYRLKTVVKVSRADGPEEDKVFYAYFGVAEPDQQNYLTYETADWKLGLKLSGNFDYTYVTDPETQEISGFSFMPKGELNPVYFTYFKNFGVCGTGLKSVPFGDGQMGIYDNSGDWSFITFPAAERANFVVTKSDVGSWWIKYGPEAMDIIQTSVHEQK